MNYYEKIIQEKRNDRYTTLKSIRTETYKGCEINISESKSPYEDKPVYVYSAHDRQMKIFVKGTAGSEADALTKAKREIDMKANAKEEKDNENFHYLGKTFSVTSGNFQQVRQQVQKAYWDKVKELEVKLRSAQGAEEQRIEKELREIREGYKETMEEFDRFNNSKEQGYYAKLAEEKTSKKH